MIPYGRQSISEADIEAVVAVLRSDFLTQGAMVPRFEESIASVCGAARGVAFNSATSALHAACLALEVGPHDVVWTSPITFVASANCALYCGAKIDFVDIDPRTFNISLEALEQKLVAAEKKGSLPKVLIAVHMAGQSCQMQAVHALSKRYGFSLIEDASHAIGGTYQDAPVGGCRYSDITVFSFHPVKIITTGEGGMAMTNSPELALRMAMVRSHGITRDEKLMTHEPHGPWYYQQLALGFNYRMTDIQAALGISQTCRLNDFVAARRGIARRYDEALADLPLLTPWVHPDVQSAFHLYVIRLNREVAPGLSRRRIFEALQAKGIGVNVHYIPVHTQPYYAGLGFLPEDFPESMRYYEEALSLPIYPDLTESQQDWVIESVREQLA